MTISQFADEVKNIPCSMRPYRLSTGEKRLLIDVYYPSDRQTVVAIARQLGLVSDVVNGSAYRPHVRVFVDGLQ
jgi:hypothetical protein